MIDKKKFIGLLLILASIALAVNLLDAVTTYSCFDKNQPHLYESNPIMNYAFANFGLGGYIFKIILLIVIMFPIKPFFMYYCTNFMFKCKSKHIKNIFIVGMIITYVFVIMLLTFNGWINNIFVCKL